MDSSRWMHWSPSDNWSSNIAKTLNKLCWEVSMSPKLHALKRPVNSYWNNRNCAAFPAESLHIGALFLRKACLP
jgi:hypothetical protein